MAENQNNSVKKVVLITVLVMLALILLWHLLLPALGVGIVLSSTVLGVAIANIILICIAAMFFFFLTGTIIMIFGVLVLIWTIAAVILFPVLFPILIPVLLLAFLIGYFARGKK